MPVLLLLGLIVSGVWIWKRIPPDTQDTIIEYGIPVALLGLAAIGALWSLALKARHRVTWRRERERLMTRFERESSREKRLELAFTLIERNGYRLNGLERVAPVMVELFSTTLQTALGDKQHRIRGMAASHLGVFQDSGTVPLLLAALDDEHWYVRSCAALGLGRMRAKEAKPKLEQVMKDDWVETVRSRAREALERLSQG